MCLSVYIIYLCEWEFAYMNCLYIYYLFLNIIILIINFILFYFMFLKGQVTSVDVTSKRLVIAESIGGRTFASWRRMFGQKGLFNLTRHRLPFSHNCTPSRCMLLLYVFKKIWEIIPFKLPRSLSTSHWAVFISFLSLFICIIIFTTIDVKSSFQVVILLAARFMSDSPNLCRKITHVHVILEWIH